jgi:hypothetical protein
MRERSDTGVSKIETSEGLAMKSAIAEIVVRRNTSRYRPPCPSQQTNVRPRRLAMNGAIGKNSSELATFHLKSLCKAHFH